MVSFSTRVHASYIASKPSTRIHRPEDSALRVVAIMSRDARKALSAAARWPRWYCALPMKLSDHARLWDGASGERARLNCATAGSYRPVATSARPTMWWSVVASPAPASRKRRPSRITASCCPAR